MGVRLKLSALVVILLVQAATPAPQRVAIKDDFWGRALQTSTTDGPSDLEGICSVVQNAFNADVRCDCFGTPDRFLSITCDYKRSICGASGENCGRPLIGVTIVDGEAFSSTSCIRDYQRGNRKLMGETCIAVTACDNPKDGMCECIASHESNVCKGCNICDGGRGISFDCTNVNVEAVTEPCRSIDTDLDLKGGAGILGSFLPQMAGFCTNLEKVLDNRVTCDCSKARGGSYTITCESHDKAVVASNSAIGIKSVVDVVQGEVNSVTACANHPEPYSRTCTALQFCEEDKNRVCSCLATYDETPCSSCQVCGDGGSVKVDCSNVFGEAVVQQCQPVGRDTSYEFIPKFPMEEKDTSVGPSKPQQQPQTSATGSLHKSTYLVTLVMTAVTVACWLF